MRDVSRDGIKLSQLRALVAIADHGNFSEAALYLEVSQSAVSHAIATLESELGVILLSRGRHGANLTPVGKQITHYARQVMQMLEQISKEANLAKGLEGGQVRLASFRSVATHILPGVIAQFHQDYPAIAITITEHQDFTGVEQALREGLADLGFTYLPASNEFETWELLRDEYIVLVSPKLDPFDTPLTWERLSSYPLILHPETESCGGMAYRHCAKFGQPLKPTYVVSEDSTIVSMVMQGLGATILPRLAAEPLPLGVKTYSLPVPLERIIGVAMLAEALHPPGVFAFLDTLKHSALCTIPRLEATGNLSKVSDRR
jgi:DNA-binding transcriptional LysR family regulator